MFVSSAAVYGGAPADVVLDEGSPLRPDSIYGASKAAAEMLVTGYHAHFGLETVILRPVSIYGPRRRTFSLPSYLVANALDDLPSRIRGGSQTLDLINVEDVAWAIALALNTTIGVGRTYTIATGAQATFKQIADATRRLLPASRIEIEPGPGELGPEGRYRVDAAEHDLGFRADCDLEQGLRQMIEGLRQRADLRAHARAARTLIVGAD